MAYAVYNNQVYRINPRDGIIRVLSQEKEEGFTNVIDRRGKTMDDLFVKEVSEVDLDFAYELRFRAEYFGHEFEVITAVDKQRFEKDFIAVEAGYNNEVAILLDFKVYDKFARKKELSFSDIDRLIEVKVPILKFKGMEKIETEIPKDKIAEYINNKVE